ncbi:hypothetical protein EUGRSUZ_I01411 [Eucalyptus grandis]|uniref:Uncharacterized protein n=2 Tax=Eucalyptus grandis TaxID=71139 RepID=A0ACC3JEN1_EUCGR|nr:hypothetical protein EUGRSUZ_I01411 [Eucalyptus grandis]
MQRLSNSRQEKQKLPTNPDCKTLHGMTELRFGLPLYLGQKMMPFLGKTAEHDATSNTKIIKDQILTLCSNIHRPFC